MKLRNTVTCLFEPSIEVNYIKSNAKQEVKNWHKH